MKKIGLLCLVLVFALGSLGIGYAAWTDTLYIDGTVNTGDVDIDIGKVSSTWVYKILGTHETVVVHDWGSVAPTPPADSELIASAVAEITSDDLVTVTLTNLFPSVDFKVDFLLHYDGSIPAKFVVDSDLPPAFTGDDAAFFNALCWSLPGPAAGYCYGEMWVSDINGNKVASIPALDGYQLHNCDYILVVITLHLGQEAPMNASADFTYEFNVIQWNEY